MRYVATCDRFFLDCPGGGYRVAWDLCREAARAGVDATLVCGSLPGDPPCGRTTIEGVEVVRYRLEQAPRLDPFRVRRNLQTAREAVCAVLAQASVTTLHGHMVEGAFAAFSEAEATTRRIYTIHSLAVDEQEINWSDGSIAGAIKRGIGMPVLRRHERRVLERADALHVLSDFTARALSSRYGSRLERKVVQIPWWTEKAVERTSESVAAARERLGWPIDVPTIFTIRRMVQRMGLKDLLEALARIPMEIPFRAVFAGDGPERPLLMNQARILGLEGRVWFPGRVSDDDVRLAYQGADVFVLPTRALEGFGIILLEALGAGCGVIASRAGAIPEIMTPLLEEWLFEPGQSEGLSRLLVEFLTGERRFPKPAALRSYVVERYGKEAILPEYLRLLGIEPRGREPLAVGHKVVSS